MDRRVYEGRARQLEYLSMVWMTVEAIVAVASGVVAHSIALIGFGLDSVVEFFAAAVVLWELRGVEQVRERRAMRLIGASFLVVAAYVTLEAIRDLVIVARPEGSIPGIVVAGAALIVMPALALGKRRVGRALSNATLLADAAESTFCALLSGATILGVSLNAVFGWHWADPIAALVVAVLAVREGSEVLHQD